MTDSESVLSRSSTRIDLFERKVGVWEKFDDMSFDQIMSGIRVVKKKNVWVVELHLLDDQVYTTYGPYTYEKANQVMEQILFWRSKILPFKIYQSFVNSIQHTIQPCIKILNRPVEIVYPVVLKLNDGSFHSHVCFFIPWEKNENTSHIHFHSAKIIQHLIDLLCKVRQSEFPEPAYKNIFSNLNELVVVCIFQMNPFHPKCQILDSQILTSFYNLLKTTKC